MEDQFGGNCTCSSEYIYNLYVVCSEDVYDSALQAAQRVTLASTGLIMFMILFLWCLFLGGVGFFFLV